MRGHRPRLQKMNQVTGKLMAIIAVMVSVAGAAQGRQWTEMNAGLPRMAARIRATSLVQPMKNPTLWILGLVLFIGLAGSAEASGGVVIIQLGAGNAVVIDSFGRI